MDLSRLLAIDYGDVRIGVAISDPLKIISTPFTTIINKGKQDFLKELQLIIEKQNISKIIMGLPLNQKAEDTDKSLQIREITIFLRTHLEIPIIFYNESFTSFEANNELKRLGYNVKESKKVIDKIAASIILKNYIDDKL